MMLNLRFSEPGVFTADSSTKAADHSDDLPTIITEIEVIRLTDTSITSPAQRQALESSRDEQYFNVPSIRRFSKSA